jgi:hypothetical protein
VGDLNDVPPNNMTHCNQTLFLVNGRATPLAPGTVIQYRVEEGMQRPAGEDLFDFD